MSGKKIITGRMEAIAHARAAELTAARAAVVEAAKKWKADNSGLREINDHLLGILDETLCHLFELEQQP